MKKFYITYILFILLTILLISILKANGQGIKTTVTVPKNIMMTTTVLPNNCNVCIKEAGADKSGRLWCYEKYCNN